MKTQGEKISYIFPQLDFCALFSVTIKKNRRKNMILCPLWPAFCTKFPIFNITLYDFISLLPYFPPSTSSVKEQLLHGLRGKK